jgi:hypothetical protein
LLSNGTFLLKQPVVARLITDKLRLAERPLPLLLSNLCRFLDLTQQLGQIISPVLSVLLVNKLQLAQVVGIAQAVLYPCKLLVGAVAIVDDFALSLGEDAYLLQRLRASVVVNRQVSDLLSACHMGPAQLVLDTHPCLVKVHRFDSVDQMLLHGGLDWLDLIRYFLTGSKDCAFGHGLIAQVSQDLSRALQGNEVVACCCCGCSAPFGLPVLESEP